jgi:hypothetical protein
MSKSLEQIVLEKARARIADPKRWTQGTAARIGSDFNSLSCDYKSADAVSFCLFGAVAAEAHALQVHWDKERSILEAAMARLAEVIAWEHGDRECRSDFEKVTTFNDCAVTHQDVLAVLDKAIGA